MNRLLGEIPSKRFFCTLIILENVWIRCRSNMLKTQLIYRSLKKSA